DATASALGSALRVGGRRLKAEAAGPRTVVIAFPEPFAPGMRLLGGLPILPRHALGAALKAGAFARAWNLTTPPEQLTGSGPFVLRRYTPGQRLVFERNPRYWRRSAAGVQLPYLDRITIEIVPDQDVEMLRLQAGAIDTATTEIRPEDYAPLKRAADAGRVRLLDLGVGFDADALWFNLQPGRVDPGRAAWLQHEALRRAIAMAVDRTTFVNTVFLGAGVPVYGPLTPTNTRWFAELPPIRHDPAGAGRLLDGIGLVDRNGDGMREDAGGRPARFTLLVQKGNTAAERGASVIREALAPLGLGV